jgi:hypothetical protein
VTVTVSVGNAVIPSGVFCWMGFQQTAIAGAAHAQGKNSLRKGAFYPSSDSVTVLKRLSLLTLAGGLKGLEVPQR